ncbi:MAG TPA: 1-(5-phosphoribosyl)-5-[(5-phosphoribosylamino)methylideneamino]imidazole-4-carboxamide isomerase [Kiritimatiellia bacterium]|nr:1-(5-phosphoribosyl)-5-[(5-phosphoribosylamino)methylideneamino]imidazole-4-carboxamide isomerase [Kiritimatiellia bacterium]HMO98462.1 1-(5-phosphoribosyl)-5-[(5-phosphoribosylamino)methylideneamino]imidazole-4-carboxamide isomerase [Kiritimatiellia bacterium]HMP96526.1 1-(5-phosphoribosyl)-5-[(5-phosphoribosylamino)methylideneamino]imidazole-4-carboxamide isomerase [Kiritimatiellia bacterium]
MNAFTIFPAVDLKGGKCVRLLQGRADAETVYGTDPVDMARRWLDEGATWLHVVDLDGAFAGESRQHAIVGRMIAALPIPVQVGGGIRTDDDIQRLLDYGAARVILGTRAWADPDGLAGLAARFGDRLAVGIDSRDGKVQIRGWTETTALTTLDLAGKADALGVQTLIVTDTATDGMLQGPNLQALDAVCRAVKAGVIASGGVTTAGDVAALRALGHTNLIGAIVGKALYEGHSRLADLQAVS